MSHSYDTSTYAAEASLVPARLKSPDQLRALVNAAFLEQKKSPDPLVCMSGTTRSGWAVYTSKALIEAVDLPSLGFLSDGGQYRFETEHGFTAVTVLAPSGVEEVAEALARDYVSSRPAFDYDHVRGDEGQGPDYFFTWLRSILRVVEVALARGQAVVHELSV